MPEKKTIFLDLDGVIANWTKQIVEKTFSLPYEEVPSYGREGLIQFIQDRTGFHEQKVKGKIYGSGSSDFWSNIEKFYWADQLVTLINRSGHQWFFLTKPFQTPGCYEGKAQWIKKYYPKFFNKLIIIPGSKGLCARNANCLLIDDHKKNLEEWSEAGGSIYLWEELNGDPLISGEEVKRRLEEIKNWIQ